MATNYTYTKYTATNGVVLHTIKTTPKNIILKAISSAVTSSSQPNYGINGGFFDFSTQNILSIAVNNHAPVKGAAGDYGVGWTNAGTAKRGTLVWDDAAGKYSVQVTDSASNLTVTDKTKYWAQGGISMSLGNDSGWAAQADAEKMPNRTGKVERAGLVYNTGLNIWLVVTNTNCTAAEFRTAIKEKVGSGTLVNGIFLDGSGSSQMKCAEASVSGDGRKVPEMVALKDKS
ncbi:phosphodiester glycosidase family protein [Paenibacillus filicis]|uniref:Phosphodiester glycosidase family protein n=1 Tax=Paenibacillus filicis TaxID=669464 RepID=A0ABU9DXI6_9BACL